MSEVVGREQAEKEVGEFLDFMEVTAAGKELPEVKAMAEGLILNIQNGRISIDENKVITQQLVHKIGETTIEIKYDPRYEMGVYYKAMKSLRQDDQMGRTMAKLSVLSKLPVGIFERMRRVDYNVASLIAVFF